MNVEAFRIRAEAIAKFGEFFGGESGFYFVFGLVKATVVLVPVAG